MDNQKEYTSKSSIFAPTMEQISAIKKSLDYEGEDRWANWDVKYFLFPFLAQSIGTLSGAVVVSKLSKNYHIIIPLFVGLYFLSGGIYMVMILPAPVWFICLDLIVCYIPMALLGWSFFKKIISNRFI